jgi:hypothetical protein
MLSKARRQGFELAAWSHFVIVVKSAVVRGWAAPVTLVGLIVAALVAVLGGRVDRVDGVIEAGGGALGRWMRRFTRIDAITLGHVVIGTSAAALECWRAHEHAHVRQYERWGALMPLLYAASSLREWRRGRDPYRHNVFEREARVIARRPKPGIAARRR